MSHVEPASGRQFVARVGMPPVATDRSLTIRGFLDARLGSYDRQRELDALCARFTDRALHDTVADLREVLAGPPIDMEAHRRLHVLISYLYHACGAEVALTDALRAEVAHSLAARTAGPAHPEERG